MIQIGCIRKGFQYFPDVYSESIVDMFKNIDKIIELIPESERWNCYYTLAHHEIGSRVTSAFKSQDIIAFDIDGLDLEQIELYPDIICEALEIDKNKTGIVNSGNGLHFLIQIETITDVKFFKQNKLAYGNTCKLINEALAKNNLTGKADEVIFEPTRIFRLPKTKNIKQKANGQITKECSIINYNIELQKLDLIKVDDVKETDLLSDGEYGVPDEEYILSECRFLKWIAEQPEEVHEPEWYAMLSITAHFNDDNKTSYALSENLDSPSINKSNKEAKIDQARERSNPRTCSSISQLSHWNGCQTCPHYKKITSPICLKSPDHIATAKMGFTLKIGDKAIVRQYMDLLRFYDKKHHHKTVSSANAIYIWDKTHYRRTYKGEIKNFALEHFHPLAKATERAEFHGLVEDSFITHESFLSNSNNEGLINFRNGVLNVKTGELVEHDPIYQFFYCLPFDYDPKAKAPNWDYFIDTVTLGRKCLQDILHEYLGYIIRGGDYIYHKALILSGDGKNGKSTFLQVVRSLVGEMNCSDTSITAISLDKFMVAELHGKLVNFSEEEPASCFKETGKFKHITGNTHTSAQFKYGQPFQMINKAKMLITYNEMPYLGDTSTGMKRRLLIVPFQFDLEGKHANKEDINLQSKLLKELAGIFNLALQGWKRLEKQKGFTKSKFVDEQVQELINSSDPFSAWIEEEVTLCDESNHVLISDAYKSYCNFVYQNYNSKPMSRRRYTISMKRNKIEHDIKCLSSKTQRVFIGIALNSLDSDIIENRNF